MKSANAIMRVDQQALMLKIGISNLAYYLIILFEIN